MLAKTWGGIVLLSSLFCSLQTQAAIALDRTRIVFNGSEKNVSLNISNENKQLPYLAQGWIEDEQGKKITSPLILLPPVQRVEPGERSIVKIQALPAIKSLPQDRESIFYFSLREIPPRSEKSNVLQIALQTRIKLFYRPQAIEVVNPSVTTPWQEKLVLVRKGNRYQAENPTPYYITLVDAQPVKGKALKGGFTPVMVPPKSSLDLGVDAAELGSAPLLTYINDYGGRPVLTLNCGGDRCAVKTNRVEG